MIAARTARIETVAVEVQYPDGSVARKAYAADFATELRAVMAAKDAGRIVRYSITRDPELV